MSAPKSRLAALALLAWQFSPAFAHGAAMPLKLEDYLRDRSPRFGKTNPERIVSPFWTHQIKTGQSAYAARQEMKESKEMRLDGPVWCFQRFGMSKTELDNGDVLYVAGEHEDSYDEDFNIYNDVIVKKKNGEIEIYGYPKDVFPPTDFHTATKVGDALFIIGSVGYQYHRLHGTTQVYRLDLKRLSFTAVPTTGTPPGWISSHKAAYDPKTKSIVVSGGKISRNDSESRMHENIDEYRLNLADGKWERLTDRKWPQFAVHSTGNDWIDTGKRMAKIDDFLPDVPHKLVPVEKKRKEGDDEDRIVDGWNYRMVTIDGVPVRYENGLRELTMQIQGPMPEPLVKTLKEDLRKKLEKFLGKPCEVDPL